MGFSAKKLELFGKSSSILRKTLLLAKILKSASQMVWLLKNSQKVWFLGLTAKYMGVFEKVLDSFQNRNKRQFFCSMLFEHSKGNIAQNFSKAPNFIYILEKQKGFSKKLIFFKNWYKFQLCSRMRSNFAFT